MRRWPCILPLARGAQQQASCICLRVYLSVQKAKQKNDRLAIFLSRHLIGSPEAATLKLISSHIFKPRKVIGWRTMVVLTLIGQCIFDPAALIGPRLAIGRAWAMGAGC